MPYIKKEQRKELDEVVELLRALEVKADGDLNYILYAYCMRYCTRNYRGLKNYCGELRQCATEIERKILAPYEDKKERENGSI